jgi:lipid II isoglutaminyl synthase (glutamine-hydrolysing)
VSADLTLVHLYPDLLRTYGDRGNVLCLQRRAEWRGFTVEAVGVGRGEPLPVRARGSVVLIGGGTDRVQELVAPDLAERRSELRDHAARGAVILGVCGGYQFLGHRYVAGSGGELAGLGLLDVETVAGPDRSIGRVVAQASLWGQGFELVGFENHGGRTELGAAAQPLARVQAGSGNNGSDESEGAVQGTVVGTYLHGPVLPVNPALADAILWRALAAVTGGEPLPRLDDALETAAHDRARGLAGAR